VRVHDVQSLERRAGLLIWSTTPLARWSASRVPESAATSRSTPRGLMSAGSGLSSAISLALTRMWRGPKAVGGKDASRSVCGPASRALETTSSAAAAGAGCVGVRLRSATTAASNSRLMESRQLFLMVSCQGPETLKPPRSARRWGIGS